MSVELQRLCGRASDGKQSIRSAGSGLHGRCCPAKTSPNVESFSTEDPPTIKSATDRDSEGYESRERKQRDRGFKTSSPKEFSSAVVVSVFSLGAYLMIAYLLAGIVP